MKRAKKFFSLLSARKEKQELQNGTIGIYEQQSTISTTSDIEITEKNKIHLTRKITPEDVELDKLAIISFKKKRG